MTTYTITDHDGCEIASGLTVEQAADEIMNSDGRQWCLEKDAKFAGWTAWSRQEVANRPWGKTVFYSANADEASALADISEQIVDSEPMRGHYKAFTDEQFAELKAIADLENAAPLMDDDIRENIHDDSRAFDPIWFMAEYRRRHAEKFGDEFSVA